MLNLCGANKSWATTAAKTKRHMQTRDASNVFLGAKPKKLQERPDVNKRCVWPSQSQPHCFSKKGEEGRYLELPVGEEGEHELGFNQKEDGKQVMSFSTDDTRLTGWSKPPKEPRWRSRCTC